MHWKNREWTYESHLSFMSKSHQLDQFCFVNAGLHKTDNVDEDQALEAYRQ